MIENALMPDSFAYLGRPKSSGSGPPCSPAMPARLQERSGNAPTLTSGRRNAKEVTNCAKERLGQRNKTREKSPPTAVQEKERKSKGGEGRTVILQGDIGAVFGLEHLGLVQLGQPKVYKQELVALNRVQKIAGL